MRWKLGWARASGEPQETGTELKRRRRHCDSETAQLRGAGELALKSLIVEHFEKSGSQMAKTLLETWETARHFFWHVLPKENVVQIEAATEGSAESEDEEETAKV